MTPLELCPHTSLCALFPISHCSCIVCYITFISFNLYFFLLSCSIYICKAMWRDKGLLVLLLVLESRLKWHSQCLCSTFCRIRLFDTGFPMLPVPLAGAGCVLLLAAILWHMFSKYDNI